MELTHQWLLEHLNYDSETGSLFIKKPFSKQRTVGVQLGYTNSSGYLITHLCGKKYRCHRIVFFYVTGRWPKEQIDHINRDKLDNRFDNLREVSGFENAQNVSRKGYTFIRKLNKYRARLQTNGKIVYEEYFSTEEKAREAYLKAKKELHPFFEQGIL